MDNEIKCLSCKHLCPITGGCLAFPGDVPYKFSSGEEIHTEYEPGQQGQYVYEPGEPEELLTLGL